jgi:hypothetical protein
MADNKYAPPEQTTGDTVHAIGSAALQLVPLVGSSAAELLKHAIMPPLERRRDDWMETVAEALRSHDVAFEELGTRPQLLDAFFQASTAAIKTSSEEKRAALRNAILNIAKRWDPDETVSQQFLDLVERFHPWHLRLLQAMNDPPGWAKAHAVTYDPGFSSSLSGFIEAAFPELVGRGDFYGQLWAELGQAGLHGTSGLNTMMTVTGWLASRTTERGKAFLRFISEPTSAI